MSNDELQTYLRRLDARELGVLPDMQQRVDATIKRTVLGTLKEIGFCFACAVGFFAALAAIAIALIGIGTLLYNIGGIPLLVFTVLLVALTAFIYVLRNSNSSFWI